MANLVLLAGTAGKPDDFRFQQSEFSTDFTLHIPTLFQRAALGGVTAMADSVEQELKAANKTELTTLVGHSLGGLVALELASRGHAWAQNIVLLDAPMLFASWAATAVEPYDSLLRSEGWRDSLIEFAEKFYFTAEDSLERKLAIISRLLALSHEEFLAFWNATNGYDAEAALKKAKTTRLLYVLAGIPLDEPRLVALAPQAELARLSRPSHYGMLELPQEVNRLIREFLATGHHRDDGALGKLKVQVISPPTPTDAFKIGIR